MDKIEILRVADRIRQDKYRIFNKELAHYIGLKESIYIAYLIDQDIFFNKTNIGKPFYKKQSYITLETTLSTDDLRKINNKFVKMNLLEIQKIGLPATNHFKINYEILNNLLDQSILHYQAIIDNISKSSACISQELDPEKFRNINNKELNNKESILYNKIVELKSSTLNGESKTKNNNINNTKKEIEEKTKYDNEVLGKDSSSLKHMPFMEETSHNPLKPSKGLGPLFEITHKTFNEYLNKEELIIALNNYLRAYLGCRRLPSEEKWKKMLEQLISYSSIELPGTIGNKFVLKNALAIIEKAERGKDGAPFLEFDNIYNVQTKNNVMEPHFNLNQEFKQGY